MNKMDYKGDIFYIGQILEGKTNAFTYIVERHKDHAYNLAFRICGSREEAEEIAQDAFMKAYRSLTDFKMRSTFSTWLYRIVYNTAISLVRTKKKGVLSLDEFPADAMDFMGTRITEEEASAEYRDSLVNFALQKISEEERALITLYYYDELKVEEISVITATSKSNVKVKLFRARQKMIAIIEKIEKKNLIYHE
jgi:RNA polymerase sigma factor (sigma-70 family)